MELALPFETWGTPGAPAVLMLHGFTGNRASWAHLKAHLGSQVWAIAVDLPGHGGAPLPDAKGQEGFEAALQALEHVLEGIARHTGQSDVAVLGYSQGARLALGLALRAPRRVNRLILESVNPGIQEPKERRARARDDAALAATIMKRGVDRFVSSWEALPLFEGVRRLPAEVQQTIRERRSSATAEGLAGALHCLGLSAQPSYWERLAKLRVPALLLTGALDAKFTALARRAVREMPLSWHRAFPNCHHAPHLEVPAAYAEEVRRFLDVPWSDAERTERLVEASR